MRPDVDEPDGEPVTVGSTEPPTLVRRPGRGPAGPAPASEPAPNGWYAGPVDDPDRYELLGTGISGGEGTLWRARYRGGLASPIPFAVKALRPPPGAAPGWPSAADRRRWHDQQALLRHLEIDHVVRLHEVFAGPAPHAATASGRPVPLVAYVVMHPSPPADPSPDAPVGPTPRHPGNPEGSPGNDALSPGAQVAPHLLHPGRVHPVGLVLAVRPSIHSL